MPVAVGVQGNLRSKQLLGGIEDTAQRESEVGDPDNNRFGHAASMADGAH